MHSDLGNGKTITALEVAVQLGAEGWAVYTLDKRREVLFSELNTAAKLPGRKISIIDSCYNNLDEIRFLLARPHDQVHMLLLSRTTVHELRAPRLFEILPGAQLAEIDLNQFIPPDIDHVVDYLDTYGLWGKYASRSRDAKIDVITNRCAGEMQAVLLVILESPVIKRRFQELFDKLEQNSELKRAVILALVLVVCEKSCDLYLLSELLSTDLFRTADVRRDTVAREFVDLDRNDVRVKSPVIARELLRQSEESRAIVETLIQVVRRLNNLRNDLDVRRLAYDLVRFSHLERLLPEADKRDSAVYLYEEVRHLEVFNQDALFWLQYAIARMSFAQYEIAERYFRQAYAIAESRVGFNTFQIDNHYARFLIESRAFGGLPGKFAAFLQADKLLQRQIREEGGNAYYPFRVARKYADFYERCFRELEDAQKRIFLLACAAVIRRIDAGGRVLERYRVVAECRSALQRVLAENRTAGS